MAATNNPSSYSSNALTLYTIMRFVLQSVLLGPDMCNYILNDIRIFDHKQHPLLQYGSYVKSKWYSNLRQP